MAEFSQTPLQSQKLEQTQVLAPQMLRRLEILARPTEELEREVKEECDKNPLLEIVSEREDFFEKERLASPDEKRPDVRRDDDSHAREFYSEKDELRAPITPWTLDDEKRREFLFNSVIQKESLYDILERQIGESNVSAKEKKILEKICANLTEKGFFEQGIKSFAKKERISEKAAEKALRLFQSFDPPGIGGHDYRDSYKIQLRRSGRGSSLAFRIVDEAYELFTKGKFAKIADEFGVTDADVREAVSELSLLKMFPADGFVEDTNHVIVPEVIFSKNSKSGEWEVEVATRFCRPKIRVSPEWKKRVLLGDVPKKDKEFFERKIKEGEEFVDDLRNRENTLEKLGEEILKSQKEFFEKGFVSLQPVTQSDIAARLGVYPSTISRTVNGKFAKTPWGTIELKNFFSKALQGSMDTKSNTAIREVIKEIIENESPSAPLTDEKISQELATRGISVARRTVRKYREILGIPSTYTRKKA